MKVTDDNLRQWAAEGSPIARELLELRHGFSVPQHMPERDANVLYLHRAGYLAIADEWRDEDHGPVAVRWWRLPTIRGNV